MNGVYQTMVSYRKAGKLARRASGLLIGVLCGIPVLRCVAFLKKIRPYFKKGGILIAGNVTTTMAEEDPLMSYILSEFVGWNLAYKTPEQLRGILERAGYEWAGCFHDGPPSV